MNRRAASQAAQVAQEEIVFDTVLKRFDRPDEVRTFEKGKFELVHIGGMTIGRATYEPGWKWSEHVGGRLHRKSCDVEHVGIVIAGRATAAMDDGRVIEMGPGDIFHIAPGHDSWVIGDEPYVSLHLLGASEYAAAKPGDK
jgi:quercetin dioxygenase-like cupin family protein